MKLGKKPQRLCHFLSGLLPFPPYYLHGLLALKNSLTDTGRITLILQSLNPWSTVAVSPDLQSLGKATFM